MGFFRNLWRALTGTPTGDRSSHPSGGTPPVRDTESIPSPDLPPGWQFEGLYKDRDYTHTLDPSDDAVGSADAIVVSQTDAFGKHYATIHGAVSRRQVGRLITKVTLVQSPDRFSHE